MTIAFDVNKFASSIIDGIARKTTFEVILTLPSAVTGDAQSLSMMCRQAILPQRGIVAAPVQRTGQGFQTTVPMGAEFNPFNVMFYCDAKSANLKLMHAWVRAIYDVNGSLVSYKDSISTTIQIIHYNADGTTIGTWTFTNAYPLFVGEIAFDWAAVDQFLDVPASFAYDKYDCDDSPVTFTTNLSNSQQPAKVTGLPSIANSNIVNT